MSLLCSLTPLENTAHYLKTKSNKSYTKTYPSPIPTQRLSNLLQPYSPTRQLRSASDIRAFVTPRVNIKAFGERSFSYPGLSVWNSLPHSATLILLPLSRPPSKRTSLINISELFLTGVHIPPSMHTYNAHTLVLVDWAHTQFFFFTDL